MKNLRNASAFCAMTVTTLLAAPGVFAEGEEAGKASFPVWILVVAAVLIAAVLAVMFLILRSGKKEEQTSQPESAQNDLSEAGPQDDPDMTVLADDDPDATVMVDEDTGTQETPEESQRNPAYLPHYLLMVQDGALAGKCFPVQEQGRVVGRDLDCSIRFPEDTPGISRRHARLFWNGNTLMLEDTNSSHGTYVQRIGRILSGQPVALQPGDIIFFAERKNAFELVSQS